ncbi:MAG: hydantoinase/oxoprolinase family protein, partial [Gemmatimonadales bacterium]
SAGADPGPACYGHGGTEPTVTDACLVLGWLDPAHPLADELRLDPGAAERALTPLARALGKGHTVTRVAAGIVTVATAAMARALKRVSVARGIDPRGMTLLPFGGAGPLFGCALADALGMTRVAIPPHPGVLSALGLAAAGERVEIVASAHAPLRRLDGAALARLFAPLCAAARAEVAGDARFTRLADCRFAGQGYELTVPVPADDPAALAAAFHEAHRARHGHADLALPVELVNVRVVAEGPGATPPLRSPHAGPAEALPPVRRQIVTRDDAVVRAEVWALAGLAPGQRLQGPAILAGPDATALIEPGFRGTVHASGTVVVERG